MDGNWVKIFHEKLFVKKDIISANLLMDKNGSDFLYQYRSGRIIEDGVGNKFIQDLENLKKNIVWGSPANTFNDPYDCNILAIMDAITLEKDWNSGINSLNENITCHTYVSCFCENAFSLPMWSYYADFHRGICVEYKRLELEEFVIPVNYDNYVIDLDSYDGNGEQILRATVTKHPDWKHEREWRMVSMENSDDLPKKGKEFKSAKPTKIYLGCKSSNELIENIKQYCISENISLYKMSMCSSEYKLIPQEISIF